MQDDIFSPFKLSPHVYTFASCQPLCGHFIQSKSWALKKRFLEAPGIDPGTSRMLSERSTM